MVKQINKEKNNDSNESLQIDIRFKSAEINKVFNFRWTYKRNTKYLNKTKLT